MGIFISFIISIRRSILEGDIGVPYTYISIPTLIAGAIISCALSVLAYFIFLRKFKVKQKNKERI